ncbi:MAG: hypothetical protein VCD00_09270 [Candidatus Hydrogenedentota bacterium]
MDTSVIKEAWSPISNQMSLSASLSDAWLEALVEVGTATKVNAGDTIISVLDANTKIGYLLISGEYCVQKPGDPELIKSAPELLGEMAELNPSGARIAKVRASTEIRMISFGWEKMNAALHERLDGHDFATLTEGLKQYAWDHFVE